MQPWKLLLGAGCLLLWAQASAESAVEAKPQHQRTTTSSRAVQDSKYAERLGRTVIEARLAALVALILDGDSHVRWVDSVDESRLLERVSPAEAINYSYSRAPWPVKDRDAVLRSRAQQDAGSLVVTIRSEARPDYLPRRDGVIRITQVDSTWTLVPLGGGRVEVNYRVHSEPGGKVPSWLINRLAATQPYNTLENLHRMLGPESRYRDASLPFIREPGDP